ncbi:MAG TPA: trypsin-like peptidase domain-containing protein [Acidimicrobiales bacterium]|nr:trypsin-like peptidase domain-containing protein [Acidimicrobiales bacterium]
MEFVDPEDEPSPFREPPAPDDRLWRHPSELPPASTATVNRRAGGGPSPWVVGAVSALGASLLSTGLVVAFLRNDPTPAPTAIERQLVRPRAAASTAASAVVDIAERVRPAIAQLKTQIGAGAGTGSGVFFRTDGHLLTNAHVVEGTSAIRVVMADGRELPARLIGTDPDTDTAVVKVDGGPFPVATLGSALDLRVGQTAIAIGSPLGLAGGPSVTVGVVSGLHREIRPRGSSRTLVDLIQTDATIVPGSSGGALVDSDGAVIGITTAAEAGVDGVGFATPIEVARSVADELIRTGRVVHVWLGIEGSDLDGVMAEKLNLDGGAMVGQVKDGSPAERSGVAPRDVVVAVDGHQVKSMGELVVALRGRAPGQTVILEVVRDHEHRTMAVTLAERPPSP